MTSSRETYYYDTTFGLQRKSPLNGETHSGSSLQEQGRRTILPPLTLAFPTSHSPGLFFNVHSTYLGSNLKSSDTASANFASHYTQQRASQGSYDPNASNYGHYASCEFIILFMSLAFPTRLADCKPITKDSPPVQQQQQQQQQQQAASYQTYQQQTDTRYSGQQAYTSYPNRVSPTITGATAHRLPPLSVPQQTHRDERWPGQGVSYYPQSSANPQMIPATSNLRSPQAAYPTPFPQYQSL